METVLRSKTGTEIIFLPVRHHSPACSWHLKQVVEDFLPDVILIEGPITVNPLIPVMVDDQTKPPFAVYYSYDDKEGRIRDEKRQYKCYYPFLDYSPELAALRCGKEKGIETAFIDLPYGDILAACGMGRGLLREDDRNNYNDDYLLSRSEYIRRLCERSGVRSFDEFWEKHFEINGLTLSSEKWFSNLLLHCRLARNGSSPESLKAEGCIVREAFMAEQISKWSRERKRLLVVTGGFHTPALMERMLRDSQWQQEASDGENKYTQEADARWETGEIGLHNVMAEREGWDNIERKEQVPLKDQGVFLMPYSMEAADALNGYASGMPFPGFYQTVWEGLQQQANGCESEEHTADTVYKQAVLEYLLRAGREARRKEGNLSTYDEICADAMTEGLCALRGKQQPGAYELVDAALSSFVKGEYNIATDEPMQILGKLMTGSRKGQLCVGAELPPIVRDFEAECRKFRLKEHSTLATDVTLSIFSKEKHRMISMFFHQMVYLETDFAIRTKGPDLQLNKDRNLIWETWKYKWNVNVTAALIDASVYGGTIREAVKGRVREKMREELDAKESALLLSRLFEMGIDENLQAVYDRLQEQMLKDTDFFSLADALAILKKLKESEELYKARLSFSTLINLCCRRLIFLLPDMAQIKEERLEEMLEAVKRLYQMTGNKDFEELLAMREEFLAALQKTEQDRNITPGLNGCIQGILYVCGSKTEADLEKVCRGYLTGTKEQVRRTASFFRGLFYCARDIIFIGTVFLEMLDGFLRQVDSESFMNMLPELRMAFTCFTPGEIDRLGASVAAIYGRKKESILERVGVNPGLVSYGTAVDAWARQKMEEMGYGG